MSQFLRDAPGRGTTVKTWLVRFLRNDCGATSAEYAFLLILVVGAVSVALIAVGNNTQAIITAGAGKI